MLYRSMTLALGAMAATMICQPAAAASASSVGEVVVTAHRGGQDSVRTEHVSYADLNLADEPGAHTLLLRINGAAGRVCGPDRPELTEHGAYDACRRRAVSDAVTAIGNSTLTALYQRGRPAA